MGVVLGILKFFVYAIVFLIAAVIVGAILVVWGILLVLLLGAIAA